MTEAINWLLINGANAVLRACEGIAHAAGALFAALDYILNPVLSPVLSLLNPVCTVIADGVYTVLSPLPVWLGLTIISAVSGVVILIAFRYMSNQAAIRRAKNDIKANLLAVRLYKDELRVVFGAQARLLWALVRFQCCMLKPILVLLLPMLLGLAQMGIRHQWRPLGTGETTLIKFHFRDDAEDPPEVVLEANPGVIVEVGPVPGGGEAVWRVRGGEQGCHILKFHVDGTIIEKQLVVGNRFQRVSAVRPNSRWTTQLLHPVERPMPSDVPAQSIEILFPSVDSWIYGANYWVLYFLVVSMTVAVAFRPLFGIQF